MSSIKFKLRKILLEGTASDDVFINIESELRDNAKSMGIDYDNSIVVNTNRTLKSTKDIDDWSKKKKQWAGFGSSWLDWIASNEPNWLGTRFYIITVNTLDIIQINSRESKQQFEKEYIIDTALAKDRAINYEKLYNDGKCGVSFRPYNSAWGSYDWYTSIDVDSLVIVNKKTIRSVKLLLDASSIINPDARSLDDDSW